MEGVTQETINTAAKLLKKQKSIFYKLKCKYMYSKLIKKGEKQIDPIKRAKLLLEAKHYLDEYKMCKMCKTLKAKE